MKCGDSSKSSMFVSKWNCVEMLLNFLFIKELYSYMVKDCVEILE